MAWAFGIQSLLFVIPSEILPVKYKSLGARLITTVSFFWFYVQGVVLPKLELVIGSYVFLGFGTCGAVVLTYFYFRMIESRNVGSVECFERFSG